LEQSFIEFLTTIFRLKKLTFDEIYSLINDIDNILTKNGCKIKFTLLTFAKYLESINNTNNQEQDMNRVRIRLSESELKELQKLLEQTEQTEQLYNLYNFLNRIISNNNN
jgi:hypothetical protein